jgi:hypothetical protein
MQRRRVFMRAMYRAATNRAILSVSGVAGATAMVMQSGALAVMAFGGYLVAFAVDLGRSARWRQAREELRTEPPPLPPGLSFCDGTARELIGRIEKARGQRSVVVENLARLARVGAQSALERACATEESAGRLLLLLERVSQYLSGGPIALAREARARLAQAASKAAPKVRAEYETAICVLSERVVALEFAENCRCLLVAKLEAIVSGLESLPPRLIAVELDQATQSALDDNAPLLDLLDEIRTLEEATIALVPRPRISGRAGWRGSA